MSILRRRGGTLVLVCLLLAGSRLPAEQPSFSETTSTVVVEVPVQVLRDGQPVRGLLRDDFELYDGRKKQELTGFEVTDLGAAATPKAALAPAGRRHFLVLFDLAFSDPKALVKARQAALDMVNKLHASDLVGVATYSSLAGPQLVLGFTPDRAQIDAAIRTLGKPELLGRNPDPLRLVLADQLAAARSAGLAGGMADARAATQEAATELLQDLVNKSSQAEQRAQQAAVINLTRSLADLGKLMGSIPGRKHVVYLSEGFDSALISGSADETRQQEINSASQTGRIWDVSSEERYGDSKSLGEVEKMLEELRRAYCTIQAVDIAGLRAAGDLGNRRVGGQDTLLNFAKSTGGELFENTNNLAGAMGEMLERTSVTYVLSFQPGDLAWDGSFHRLKVEVKNQPRGTRVVFRPGYYAPKPFAQRSALEKMLDAQTKVVAGDDLGSLDMAVLAAPFKMPGERAYVPVLIEVDGKTLLAGKQGPTLPAELFVYAFDGAGVIQDYLTQTLGFEIAKVQAVLQQSGFKFFGHLELPPGDYSLRVLVRNGSTGESGLRIVPLRVPAFATEAALLPPFVPEPPNRWLMAREQPRGDYQQAPYPFMLAGNPYIPASRPVLPAGEETQLALVGYSLGEGKVEAQARVLGLDGKEVGPASIEVLKREAGAQPARLVANVKPPKLAPGEYRLEVKLSAAGTAHTSSMPFVVRGG
jgi:VWFA-related protein